MSSTPTDFNDMINVHGKSRAFELINQIVNEGIARIQRGEIAGRAPASEGVDAPPNIEGPPLDDYADEVGTKIADQLAQATGGSGNDESWRKLLLKKNDALVDCRENVYLLLQHHPVWQGVLWADEFARKIIKRNPAPWDKPAHFTPGAEWGDDDDLRLGMWLAQQERLIVRNTNNLTAAIGWHAREYSFHPVRDYLDGLVWDGIARGDEWLTDYIGVKRDEYTQLCGRFFLIGMVARIYEPGCPMRFMPIFEGEQYRGKSTAFKVLGGPWFSDAFLDLNNKDAYQLIQGVWLHEVAELDAFNRAESTRIKAFISSRVDRFRAPYDRAPRDWLRSTVFGGTTNQDEYFKDTTGNTRYWPMRAEAVQSINLEGLASVRDQLFAEAVHLYRAGARWHPLLDEQIRLFGPEQEAREIVDPWQSSIATWLQANTFNRITVLEILTECLKIDVGKIDGARQMSTRVGIAMKRLGWHREREATGAREWYYVRPKHEQGKQGVDDDAPF